MANIEKIIKTAEESGCEVRLNEPMKIHTSFKIGGNASLFIRVNSLSGLKQIVKVCKEEDYPTFVLGKGSNILVSDEGMNCAVIKLGGDFNAITLVDDDTVYCGAAVSLAKLCTFAADNSLSGLEFAWGIPGSAGGAAYMNAGAYGGEMKDVLLCCNHLSPNGETGTFSKKELDLSYRHSVYSDKDYIITGLTVKLIKDSETEIRKRMDDFMFRRKSKQPLEYPSAGSVFKRPEGYFAGTLIEQSGLKGCTIGGAQVSEKHAGFIINKGDASAGDVKDLIAHVQKTVFEKYSVNLECEVRFV